MSLANGLRCGADPRGPFEGWRSPTGERCNTDLSRSQGLATADRSIVLGRLGNNGLHYWPRLRSRQYLKSCYEEGGCLGCYLLEATRNE